MGNGCDLVILNDHFPDLLKENDGYLVNGDTVHIGVINKPDNLVGEKFTIVLGGQVWLSGLRGVQLQTFTDALPEHIQGRVGLHDLSHGLLN